jgi:hypothetical protein
VLQIVAAMRTKGTAAGKWSGVATFESSRFPITMEDGVLTSPPLGLTAEPMKGRVGNGWAFGEVTRNGLPFPYYLTVSREK